MEWVWDSHHTSSSNSDIDFLDRVQNGGAKFVTGNYFTDSGSSDQNLKTFGLAMLFTILVLDERRTR